MQKQFVDIDSLGVKLDCGLSSAEAKKRVEKFGLNVFDDKKKLSAFLILLRQLKNPLIFILVFAFFASVFISSYKEAVVILLAILINVLIGFYQEFKAQKIFVHLSNALKIKTLVLRDCKKQKIDSKFLVPGDIIILSAGNKVPADALIVESENLIIDESVLSGESEPQDKKAVDKLADGEFEPENILYSGTLVADGYAKAVVFATGERSFWGKLTKETKSTKKDKSPSEKRIEKISKYITYIMTLVLALTVFLAVLRGMPFYDLILLAIALAVSAIPEGLPAAILSTLAVGMERILKKGGLAKSTSAAETLGVVDYILTDKTGTLTEGKMSLVGFYPFSSTQNKKSKDAELDKDAFEILRAAILASDGTIEKTENKLSFHGRPIEQAILKKATELDLYQDKLFDSGFTRLDFQPFSSERRFAVSLNNFKGKKVLFFSGAPESLIEISSLVRFDSKDIVFDKDKKDAMLLLQEHLSKKALRLTAAAYAILPGSKTIESIDYSKLNIVFLGFMAFEDPVREDVPDSIKEAKKLGVEVLMLTGDNQFTALSVAKKSGIISENENKFILGADVERYRDDEILKIINENKVKVFARMLPKHKKKIARILKENKKTI